MYGDSLVPHARHPMNIINIVIWYLKTLMLTSKWTLCPLDFHVPVQKDGHSCGVIVLSTIRAGILSLPVWTNKNKDQHCVIWFLWCTNPGIDQVGTYL